MIGGVELMEMKGAAMSEEIWKPISGFEGLYEISTKGRVKSLARMVTTGFGVRFKPEIMMKLQDSQGYRNVQLKVNGRFKNYRIHRLVAETFLPNPNNFTEVNHIDEDKSNSNLENLEWVSREQNMNWGTINVRMSQKQKLTVKFRRRDEHGRFL